MRTGIRKRPRGKGVEIGAEEVRRLIGQGLSDATLGRRLGISGATVRAFRHRHGIPSASELRVARLAEIAPPFPLLWPPLEEHLHWFLAQGFTDREIGRHYGKRASVVFGFRSEREIPSAWTPTAGVAERARVARLDPAKTARLYGSLRYEDMDEVTLRRETQSPDFRRDARSKLKPKNFAAMNDPAFRRLVIA